MDDRQSLLDAIAKLMAENAQFKIRIAELEAEVERLRKERQRFRPKPRRKAPEGKSSVDRRRKGQRKHPGFFRQPPVVDENTIMHDVHIETCPQCGGHDLETTGVVEDHLVEDIPEPRVEVHCYRHHQYRCRGCRQTCCGVDSRELPGSHIGPRARLLQCFARSFLGTSLGKTNELLHQFFGLNLSRAGGLGHLKWGSKLFAPVVQQLLELLRQSAVVHADETGWRIDGANVWAWCFGNPKIAVFLIRQHRSAAVLQEALGASFAGVLVSDFYSAYQTLDYRKQKCLVHLLRELHQLQENLPKVFVTRHIRPLIDFFQEAMALAARRKTLTPEAFAVAGRELKDRFWTRHIWRQSRHPDCVRIYNRLRKHQDELFTFLDYAEVPADNNAAERDIRSVAATRTDGGVNRTAWGAAAFANIKSVIRTAQKNGLRFLDYALQLWDATFARQPLPLPLDSS